MKAYSRLRYTRSWPAYHRSAPHFCLTNAALWGHWDSVKQILEIWPWLAGIDTINEALAQAGRGGSIETVEVLLAWGATGFNWTLEVAARAGHLEIVKLMLAKGATRLNKSMAMAALGGHFEIVKLLKEVGAKNFDTVLIHAVNQGYRDIVELVVLDCSAKQVNRARILASRKNYRDIAEFLRGCQECGGQK